MTKTATDQATFRAHYSHAFVEIETDVFTGRESIHISPIWTGVDRPNVGGWAVGPQHAKLAERLRKACDAGAAFGAVSLKTDVNGQTYISAEHLVTGRHMNADLRRVGF